MRALLIAFAVCIALAAGGIARADKLCVGAGLKYPMPGSHRPHQVDVGPYCVPIP